MRRNRKMPKKMSVMATNTMRFGAIIVVFFVMVILNILSSSSCTQLSARQGEMRREIKKLEDACQRESTRWEEMTTPENVEIALFRHGLSMKAPRAAQTGQMRESGAPRPGQLSLAKAKLRYEGVSAAAKPRPTARGVRGRRR